MIDHLKSLRERLALAIVKRQWEECSTLEARIFEAEYLCFEMQQQGLLK